MRMNTSLTLLFVTLLGTMTLRGAQTPSAPPQPAGPQATVPQGYVIGLDDVLGVLFWRDETMSGDFIVRPDGRISLPLLNDIDAVGLTPEQLRIQLLERAKKFLEEPSVTVVVRQINSRKVFVTGQIARPGSFPLTAPTTVLQLIALAGGLTDFADGGSITIIRAGQKVPLKFNYNDVSRGRNLEQNVELKPGDTIVIP
jgi:polysaccharide export outer membrane protein